MQSVSIQAAGISLLILLIFRYSHHFLDFDFLAIVTCRVKFGDLPGDTASSKAPTISLLFTMYRALSFSNASTFFKRLCCFSNGFVVFQMPLFPGFDPFELVYGQPIVRNIAVDLEIPLYGLPYLNPCPSSIPSSY